MTKPHFVMRHSSLVIDWSFELGHSSFAGRDDVRRTTEPPSLERYSVATAARLWEDRRGSSGRNLQWDGVQSGSFSSLHALRQPLTPHLPSCASPTRRRPHRAAPESSRGSIHPAAIAG